MEMADTHVTILLSIRWRPAVGRLTTLRHATPIPSLGLKHLQLVVLLADPYSRHKYFPVLELLQNNYQFIGITASSGQV